MRNNDISPPAAARRDFRPSPADAHLWAWTVDGLVLCALGLCWGLH